MLNEFDFIDDKLNAWSVMGAADWMSTLPDARPLSHICLPGSHDSATAYTQTSGVVSMAAGWACNAVNCQALSIFEQLEAGIRFLDIRLYPEKDILNFTQFICVHGANDLRYTCLAGPGGAPLHFDDVEAICRTFLQAHPTETIVVSIKKEDGDDALMQTLPDPPEEEHLLGQDFTCPAFFSPTLWHTAPTVPPLGAVRGKLVLVRRFALPAPKLPFGIDLSTWDADRDNRLPAGVYPIPKGAPVPLALVQDDFCFVRPTSGWTAQTKWDDRVEPAFELFKHAAPGHPLQITCTSCTNLINVPGIANTLNPNLITYLKAQPMNSFHCWVVSDYVTKELCRAVFSLNDPN